MAMKYFAGEQRKELGSMGLEGINAYLSETVCSDNPTAPITCGFFRLEAGQHLEYTYSYDECKLMLEGEMTLAEEGGQTVDLRPGDVVYFDSGTKVTFSSKSSGTVFYVGQRKLGEL